MRRQNRTTWLDHDHWSCGRHLPAQVLPATIERCWLCPNKRPSMECRPAASDSGATKKVRDPGKRKARRPAKPKMIVARRQGSSATDALAGAVASPPPSKAGTPKKAVKTAARKPVAKKAAPKIAPSANAGCEICAWADCQQPARPRSKYCSRNCSNKNARARHKARK